MKSRTIKKIYGTVDALGQEFIPDSIPADRLSKLLNDITGEVKKMLPNIPWTGTFGLVEYITETETWERRREIGLLMRNLDFTSTVENFIGSSAAGQWVNLINVMKSPEWDEQYPSYYGEYRNLINQIVVDAIRPEISEHMKEYDRQLAARIIKRESLSQKGFPSEYGLALPPVEPLDSGSLEWNMVNAMKTTLALDPVMLEVDEEFGHQNNPYYSVVENTVRGFVGIGGAGRKTSCGGYCAGVDAEGYPLFVTALHCIHAPEVPTITTASGEVITCTVIAQEEDSAILRGNVKMTGLQSLPLGENRSPWGLAVSPRYKEAELIHHNPEWGKPWERWIAPVDRYSFINRARGGWSGSPVLNSQGEVSGILSWAGRREGMPYAWSLSYTPIDVLQKLYQKVGLR